MSGNGGLTRVASIPEVAYCMANRPMHEYTTLHSGSHPSLGFPGHSSRNLGNGAFPSMNRSSFAPCFSLNVSPSVCPTPITTPAPPKSSGTHNAVSNTPFSRTNAVAKTSSIGEPCLNHSGTAECNLWNQSTTDAGGTPFGPHSVLAAMSGRFRTTLPAPLSA